MAESSAESMQIEPPPDAAPRAEGAEALTSPAAFPIPVLPAEGPPVAVGDHMELTSLDEGLIGSWYAVEIVEVEQEGEADVGAGKPAGPRALVTYTAYPDQDQEWVELSYENGWWEVQYLGRSGATLRVHAVRYGKVHEVGAALLRPGWQHRASDDEWTLMLGGVTLKAAAVQAGDLYTLTEDGVPDKVLSVSRQPAPGWNTAEVLKVNDDSTLLVAYLANAAEPPNVTVEVANVAEEEGNTNQVSWKPAEVVAVLGGGRFRAMVNGEEDFIEEFGMEDERKEWRKVPPSDIPRVQKANEAAKKKRKSTAGAGGAEDDEPLKKKVPTVPAFRFGFGMEVEVRGVEVGYEGSWYSAEVLAAKEADFATVVYDELFEAPTASTQAKEEVNHF
ncbi:hypothetical protein Ctob_008341 [Chrysochromulina tobinii]|uniref:Agenet-like domain-containing protein n=1 Tax=Chrysochromulina tobinii TaxID=1460289 RepID=A0A0M0JF20_9EUKA|nr:hypothetical protein Ctob_008615 [Chrysochromulina tobinii]KOO28363.1 hypothetical protein Ctob_008341 [Chrysochromulina tobinii]|eukprot:KOO24843.1 hypothetical protein Ctob_008615 [Chrysochromulina sp. CCMP291]